MKTVTLRPFEEVFGVLRRVERDDLQVAVILSCSDDLVKVVFQAGSPEACALEQLLSKDLLGFNVGILRTDEQTKPLLIRIVEKRSLRPFPLTSS
jgi:hypothetical protein